MFTDFISIVSHLQTLIKLFGFSKFNNEILFSSGVNKFKKNVKTFTRQRYLLDRNYLLILVDSRLMYVCFKDCLSNSSRFARTKT